MPTHLPFPDVEAVVRKALAAEGVRAYSSLPKAPNYPVVTIQRTGGLPTIKQLMDAPVIDFNAWGNNKGEARDLADDVRLIVHELEDTVDAEWACRITAVEDSLPMIFQPDPETKRDRYVFGLRIYAITDPVTS